MEYWACPAIAKSTFLLLCILCLLSIVLLSASSGSTSKRSVIFHGGTVLWERRHRHGGKPEILPTAQFSPSISWRRLNTCKEIA